MNERRRPPRRGRGHRPHNRPMNDPNMESSPYRDDQPMPAGEGGATFDVGVEQGSPDATGGGGTGGGGGGEEMGPGGTQQPTRPPHQGNQQNQQRDGRFGNNGRRGRRGRGRPGPRPEQQHQQSQPSGPPVPIVPDGATKGWFDASRDGGYIRRAAESYLPNPADAFVPPHLVRQFALRRGDLIDATTGHDHRGRTVVAEIQLMNDGDPALALEARRFHLTDRELSRPQADAGDGTSREGRTRAHAARDRSDRADRLRPARADRRAGARRQDDAAPRDHRRRRGQPSATRRCSSCSWTSAPRK